MQRLAILRPDYAYLQIDVTGRILNHCGKLPFHLVKDEPLCAQLPLFDQGPELNVAAFGDSVIAIAIGRHALFLPLMEFAKSVYTQTAKQRPLGSTCRLCDVQNCPKRSAASATRPAGLNDYIRGVTDYEPI